MRYLQQATAADPEPSDPHSAAAHLDMAASLLRANQPDAAFASADRVLAIDGDSARCWFILGMAQRVLGERAYAAMALERSVGLDPLQPAALAELGVIYDELDRPLLAEQRLLDALKLDPADKASHVNLSSLYGRAEQFELAREHALRALALDSASLGAHQNLAGIYGRIGREDEARRHRELAYCDHNLLLVTTRRPLRRVLVLTSADRGNSPDRYLLPFDRYDRLIWFIEYASETQVAALPPYDVVFNAIGDPDATRPTAENTKRFLRICERPVLNRPEAIARTSRHLAPSLFAGIDGLVTPDVVRVSADNAAGAFASTGLEAPLLVRPVGAHGGEGMTLLASFGDSAAVGGAFVAGREHYVTSFHDFRSADGLYRKYRMFFVDRKPYPYHLAIGSCWLVHYQTSGTAGHPDRLAEELRFLEDPEGVLGRAAMDALRAIGRRMDLDFCGVDFSLLSDGRVLLFEANAAMLAHPESPDGPLAQKNRFVGRILEAFWALVERERGERPQRVS